MEPTKTATGYRWEKDETPRESVVLIRRDVDDKVFLEATQTVLDEKRSRIRSRITPTREFVSIELTTKDLNEIRDFCLVASMTKTAPPYCYGKVGEYADEQCYACPVSKDCDEKYRRTS